MSLEQKLEFFKLLVAVGFKEIEVGFPAASETEYEFLRTLIEKDMIPDDVTIQVLTQAREHIIKKTFEAVKGAPRAVEWKMCGGKVAAEYAYIYPPGIPLIVPGERISEKIAEEMSEYEKMGFRIEGDKISKTRTNDYQIITK